MPYIYKITNDINGKIYIGKTLSTIEQRFKEHCQDYLKERKGIILNGQIKRDEEFDLLIQKLQKKYDNIFYRSHSKCR